jgi:hypothetical protein
MKHPDGGLPKGYEGCTTLEELADRQKALDSQPLQGLTARRSTGQSWKPPRTSSPNSRSFSTFRAAWTTLNKKMNIKESPDQASQSQSSIPSEADVLEAKRQYDVAKDAWKLARDVDLQALEKRAADMREANLAWNRKTHAWRQANDSEYAARIRRYQQVHRETPARREFMHRFRQLPKNRARNASHLRSQRANDPFFRLRGVVYDWVWSYPLVREMLAWSSYRPILSSERVEHRCQGCGYVKSGGLKLCWRSKSDADMYLCHTCYMKSEDGGLPEAYKDCANVRELNARYKQLEGSTPKYSRSGFDEEAGQESIEKP